MYNKILLEIQLELNQYETTTERNSTDIFEWLGDIGGLEYILAMVIEVLSTYFSAKFFNLGVAQTLYVAKKSKNEI